MIKFWFNVSMLAAESQRVIWLRMIKLSHGGPAADLETTQMVLEKVVAATAAAGRAVAGSSPTRIVQGYRREVRANFRRLSR
jgi:hypothetical protein